MSILDEQMCDNGNAPGCVGRAPRGLTRSSGTSREGLPMKGTRIPERVAQRALTRYVVDSSTGCHVSTYSVASHGYAQIGWQDGSERTVTLVHRVVWAATFGDIPEGMTVDHMCKRRQCCNVEHLRLLTNYENARRTGNRDWPLGRCVNGHPNSESYAQPAGKRICRPCNEAAQARYRAKKRGEVAA